MRAVDVNYETILRWVKQRQRSVANGTVNRDLTVLRRAFTYARDVGKLATVPYFINLPEALPRQGFVTKDELERVVTELPEYLKDFTRFAFETGWRKGEITSLTWKDIDFGRKFIEIRIRTSKSGYGRVIRCNATLRSIIERRARVRQGDYVFHFRGRAISDFKKAWRSATIRADLTGRTFHDLRRSAIRRMADAGIPRRVAKEITGHRTDSVFDRYHIVTDEDVSDALKRLDEEV